MASSQTTAEPQGPKSQYHHFIPRFILRNYAHAPETHARRPTRGRNRGRQGRYRPDEPVLYTINLTHSAAEIIETTVSRTFGQQDMYRDFANATNQHYLEEQLSKLESHAGVIISRIRKAFETGQKNIWITRSDRDALRKFLFIMRYRGSHMHKRFYHQNEEDYPESDKARFLRYMREKGFHKLLDVWFDNIRAMLELKMDPDGHWMQELEKRIIRMMRNGSSCTHK